jgi:hypothetical protein
MKLLTEDQYIDFVKAFVPQSVVEKVPADTLRKILLVSRDRLTCAGEFATMDTDTSYRYMHTSPYDGQESASLLLVPEKMRKGADVTAESTKKILQDVYNLLEQADDADFVSVEQIKSKIWDYAEEKGRGIVLWPLRIAVTLQEKSVDPFSMLYILGKQESLTRIQKAIGIL